MRIRPGLAATLLLAALLPVALPAAVNAVVSVHLAMHHSPGHDHAVHHHAGDDHQHRMDAADGSETPAILPPSPALPTAAVAERLPAPAIPQLTALGPDTGAFPMERRGPPPPLLHLHCSLLL